MNNLKGGWLMTYTFNEHEVELLKKSIQHCLDTCNKGGAKDGCKDCKALEEVLNRLSQ